MSSYPPIGEQIEGRPNLIYHSQTKSFWNKTTLKVSALSIAITAVIGAIFSIEVGLIALTVTFTAYIINHFTNREEKEELRPEFFSENERESKRSLFTPLQTTDFIGSFGEKNENSLRMRLADWLVGLNIDKDYRKSIFEEYDKTFSKGPSKGDNLFEYKNKIEEFFILIKGILNKSDIEISYAKPMFEELTRNLYEPLLPFFLDTLNIQEITINLEKSNKITLTRKTIIETILNQHVKTTIVHENLIDLFISGDYFIEETPSCSPPYRIYNTYEILTSYFLFKNNSNFKPPEDTACYRLSKKSAYRGLAALGIKNPRHAWDDINTSEETSDPRTPHEKIYIFFNYIKGNTKKDKFKRYLDKLIKLYKRDKRIKEESKASATLYSEQPGLNTYLTSIYPSKQEEGLGLGLPHNGDYNNHTYSSSTPLQPASGEGYTPRSPSTADLHDEVEI